MPRERQIFADGDTILISIYQATVAPLAAINAEIAACEAGKKTADDARADLYVSAQARESGGEKIDWAEFFKNHPPYHPPELSELYLLRREIRGGWTDYDLELFSGRDDLSASEKQAWRAEVRKLTNEGLLERNGTAIRLTEAGIRNVETLPGETP